jgi:Domain of unknown function (DUF6249)
MMWLNDMLPVLVLIVSTYFVLELVKVVTESRLRQKLIDKGLVDEKAKLLFEARPLAQSASALKWGLVLVAMGLAFLITFGLHRWVPADIRGEMTAGVVFFMAGLGMIVYYAIARGQEKKE